MQKEIETWKKQNGNNSYSQRDMLIYLVHKTDKIEERIVTGGEEIRELKTTQSFLKKMVYGIYGIIGAGIIGGLVTFVKRFK